MKILSESDPLEIFSKASNILNTAVEHTLGPKGTNTAVHFQNFYNIINDGKSIVEQLTSTDPEIAPAVETLKQSSFETNRKAGDGTTSTIILMNQLIQGAKKYLDENKDMSKVEISNIILQTEKKLQELIQINKMEIDNKLYKDIAEVSLGSSEYSQMISDAFNFLEGNGIPALVKSDLPGVEVEYIEGVNLTKTSVASSMFIDLLPSKELKDVRVISMFQVIDRFEEMYQLVRKLSQLDKYVILLYNEMSASVLENLLFNLSQDRSKIIPVCLKNYGKDMANMFDEISKYVEASIIDGGALKATDISNIEIGYADKAILTQESLTLIRNTAPDVEFTLISKKACIIRVGGATKIDLEDTYRRIEDAIYSLSGAIKNGALKGGYGYPYKMLSEKLASDRIPVYFIPEALSYINDKIFEGKYNERAVDSALVISQVIKNAFTTAAQAITTNAIIYDTIR